ncbi:hypothetical protein Sipo8835_26225 [Streptomyces ipomoeae]|uniref:Scaffolding protein n=1 Tax=Streptomyces ipomoeae TaxID=103232 RepID=A0AAE8W282_9ACTN|nr:hypothetical protein [Streptomyces ipomoeae]TQE28256.1 hypothetical protein Sipo8835_26225 [Streptomyces ipomoeae]
MTRPSLPSPLGYRRDGRPIYPILGASGEDPSNQPSAAPKTFTQEQVTTLLAREKQQGGRAAVKELLEQTGFADAAALAAFIQDKKQAEAEALSELERREKAAADKEQAAAAREAAAVTRERAAQRRAALVALGATGDDLADAEQLLTVPDDADDQALAEAAKALAARRPELFGTSRETAPPAPGGSPAGGPPPRGTAPAKPGAAGLEMARRRGYVTSD